MPHMMPWYPKKWSYCHHQSLGDDRASPRLSTQLKEKQKKRIYICGMVHNIKVNLGAPKKCSGGSEPIIPGNTWPYAPGAIEATCSNAWEGSRLYPVILRRICRVGNWTRILSIQSLDLTSCLSSLSLWIQLFKNIFFNHPSKRCCYFLVHQYSHWRVLVLTSHTPASGASGPSSLQSLLSSQDTLWWVSPQGAKSGKL